MKIPKNQPKRTVKKQLPVIISHPDKVFWPEDGFTKGDLAEFYVSIFPKLEPYVKDRLLTLERCPDGMAGQCFYQKEMPVCRQILLRNELKTRTARGPSRITWLVAAWKRNSRL